MNWSEQHEAMLKSLAKATLIEAHHTDGVDNSPESIEQIRTELSEHRNQALSMGEMRYAVLMSHVIVLLAELKDIKVQQAKWPEVIRGLVAQARKDVANLSKEKDG